MKNAIKLFALFTLVFIAGTAQAQNSSNVTVNEGATIAQPLRLTKVTDLQWGGIITGSVGGNVVIAASGNSFVETFPTSLNGPVAFTGHSAGVTPPSIAGFTVSGEPSLGYNITVNPGASHVTSGSNSMIVTLSNPVAATVNGVTPSGHMDTQDGDASQLSSASSCATYGTDAWVIGGTIAVGANQPSGTYTGTFTVTISYQ